MRKYPFMNFVIKTLFNCEDLLAEEIKQLGGSQIKIGNRLVECSGDLSFMYTACLQLRTALRILTPITSFRASTPEQLYKMVYGKAWESIIRPEQTFAIDPVVFSLHFKHSKFAALKVKDAIVDKIRDKTGLRPSIDTRSPDIRVHLHIHEDKVSVYLDASGFSLNQRKYRAYSVEAPINEVLAAAIIKRTGYHGERPFLDPMAGSGTFAIEAAMIATNTPPQLYQDRFCFQQWQNYDQDLWNSILEQARKTMRTPAFSITAFDSSFKAYKAISANSMSAHLENFITIERKKIENLTDIEPNTLIVTNPPYDERLELDNIENFYEMIGNVLRDIPVTAEAWIITAVQDAPRLMHLRSAKKYQYMNGEFKCALYKFEIFGTTN